MSLPIAQRRAGLSAEFRQSTNQLTELSNAEKRHITASYNLHRRSSLLSYEDSPLEERVKFLTEIPPKIIILIASIANAIFYGTYYCLSFGLSDHMHSEFKSSYSKMKNTFNEILYAFYAAIYPSKGIDAYYDLKIRQLG